MLTLESFARHLLWLCLKVSHLLMLTLESLGAVWTLPVVDVRLYIAGVCVSTSSAWSHRYSTSWNISFIMCWWSSSSATCSHSYSWWWLELFDRLTISHAHILLLVGAIDGLLILNIILLLVHVSARIQYSGWSWSTCRANICLGDVLSITARLLHRYGSWCSYRIARLLLIFLLLLNHLPLIHLILILGHHILYLVHLLVLLRLILLFELMVANRVELFEYVYKHRFLCFDISLICVSYKIHIYFTITCFSFGLERSVERIFLIELIKIFITNFGGNYRNITGRHITEFIPLQVVEKWMCPDFFGAVSTQSRICVTNQPLQDICRRWR